MNSCLRWESICCCFNMKELRNEVTTDSNNSDHKPWLLQTNYLASWLCFIWSCRNDQTQPSEMLQAKNPQWSDWWIEQSRQWWSDLEQHSFDWITRIKDSEKEQLEASQQWSDQMRSCSLWRSLLRNSHMDPAEGLSTVCKVLTSCFFGSRITFIARARPGASGSQTLAANSDVELNQPVGTKQ